MSPSRVTKAYFSAAMNANLLGLFSALQPDPVPVPQLSSSFGACILNKDFLTSFTSSLLTVLYFKYFESDNRSITDTNLKVKKITDDGYYWAGFSTRFFNDQSFKPSAIVPMLGLKKSKFYAGFAYQYNINEAEELNHAGTFLLTLGYDFDTKRASRW